jgi:hypothetical protein
VSGRVLLARRTSGTDYAVVFESDGVCIEGGFALRRRVPYRAVSGLERHGPWLWLASGLVPTALGGRDVEPERLDGVERELRRRIGALPAGERRLARLDRRRPSDRRVPWVSVGATLAAGVALLPGTDEPLALAASLLLFLAFGLVVEGWLGLGPALVSAGAGLLAAQGIVSGMGGAGVATPQLVSAAWIGLLGFTRVLREAELSVLTRSAIDTAALVAVAFFAVALVSGTSPRLLLASALAGFVSGALVPRPRSSGP